EDATRFTWEPEPGVKLAAIIKHISDDTGFILAAKNLSEIEHRSRNITTIIGLAWIFMLLLSAILTWILTQFNFMSSPLEEDEIEIVSVTETQISDKDLDQN
ncbi:MAG: hypothetical protein R3B41_03530, partial [Candidatus Doudnabacteria bacterium]